MLSSRIMVNNASIDSSILNVARSLLAENDGGFTMEQLEAKTGISRSTLYRRMGTKEMLLKRLAHERGETFEKPETRRGILEAARVVFGRNGLAAATMEQIAHEAGVGIATVYRHFGDKESLIRAFVAKMVPRTAVQALALHPGQDVAHDLEEMIKSIMAFFFDNRDLLRLVLMGSEADRHTLESLRQGSDTTLSLLTNYFRSQLDAGRLQNVGKPGELALALMGMMLAFAVVGPLHYGTTPDLPEQSSKLIVTIFLNDLRGNQP